MFVGPLKSFTATPREATCHVTTAHVLFLLLRGEGPLRGRTERQADRAEYELFDIFTEISFSPET